MTGSGLAPLLLTTRAAVPASSTVVKLLWENPTRATADERELSNGLFLLLQLGEAKLVEEKMKYNVKLGGNEVNQTYCTINNLTELKPRCCFVSSLLHADISYIHTLS